MSPSQLALWLATRWPKLVVVVVVVVAFGFEDVDAESSGWYGKHLCLLSGLAGPRSSFCTCSFLYHISSDLYLSVEPVW